MTKFEIVFTNEKQVTLEGKSSNFHENYLNIFSEEYGKDLSSVVNMNNVLFIKFNKKEEK